MILLKLIYKPFGIVIGLITGLFAKKVFDFIWARFDDEEPPEAEHRDVSMPKLIAANAVQGAIFRGVRAGSDHYTRAAFSRATGVWPGEKEPDEARL